MTRPSRSNAESGGRASQFKSTLVRSIVARGRVRPGIITLALAVSLLGLGRGQAIAEVGGPVCNVPADYSTIQGAVNDSGCSVIRVSPGAYAENVTIARPLFLFGAQLGVAVGSRTSGGLAESTISGVSTVGASAAITISASDVTVDGFTLKNSTTTTGSAAGVYLQAGAASAEIKNTIIDGISTADTGANGTAQGINIDGGPDDVQITGNLIQNIQSNRSAKAVIVGQNGETNSISNLKITSNTMQTISSTGSKGGYGVLVNSSTPGHSNLEIRDNTITSLTGGWVHAISLDGDTPNVVVAGNTISNLANVGDAKAISFESNPSFDGANVHNNNFNIATTATGIAVAGSPSSGNVNGTCNWWGAASGPGPVAAGSGALVTANVTYTPWLTAQAPGGGCATIEVSKDFIPDNAQSVSITVTCTAGSPQTLPASELASATFTVGIGGVNPKCTVSEASISGYYTKIFCDNGSTAIGSIQALSYTFRVNPGDAVECRVYNVTPPSTCDGISFSKVIIGSEGDDELKGGSGNDFIVGLGGDDEISGSGGNDCILGNDGEDEISGGSGNDVIYGGNGNDDLEGGNGDDIIRGDAGNDTLNGGNNADNLQGGDDNDTVSGGTGNDTLYGNGGTDVVKGSTGTDRCSQENGGSQNPGTSSCEQPAPTLPG